MGTSLNDQLLQGPERNNNLIGVLVRFWEKYVSVVSDIDALEIPVVAERGFN